MGAGRRRARRLAVAVLVAWAAAIPTALVDATGLVCDRVTHDPTDPTHLLYGFRNDGIDTDSGKFIVDVSGAPSGMMLFHDGVFPSYSSSITVPPDIQIAVNVPTTGAIIVGSPHADVICGTTGDDIVIGGEGDDRVFGFGSLTDYDPGAGDGGDRLLGNRGDDLIVNGRSAGDPSERAAFVGGGPGNDTIVGGRGADFVRGGAGNDLIAVDGSDTQAFGNAGDDVITVPPDGGFMFKVTLSGNRGSDTLNLGRAASSRAFGGRGADVLTGGSGLWQRMWGGRGGDVLTGGQGAEHWMFGGPGDDLLTGGPAGVDAVAGLPGVSFAAPAPADFDDPSFAGPTNQVATGLWQSSLTGIHRLFGGDGADTLRAHTGPFTYGAVLMIGGPGDDTFVGGGGRDYMVGIDGDNTFDLRQLDGRRDFAVGGPGDDTYLSACDADDASSDVAMDAAGGFDRADRFLAANLRTQGGGPADSAPQLFQVTDACTG